jgi:hypothetical protein
LPADSISAAIEETIRHVSIWQLAASLSHQPPPVEGFATLAAHPHIAGAEIILEAAIDALGVAARTIAHVLGSPSGPPPCR